MLEHRTSLKKFKKTEIILNIFSNYNTSVAAQPWSHGLTGPSTWAEPSKGRTFHLLLFAISGTCTGAAVPSLLDKGIYYHQGLKMVRVLAGPAYSPWGTVRVCECLCAHLCSQEVWVSVYVKKKKKEEMSTVLGTGSGCGSGPRLSMCSLRVPTASQNVFSIACPVSDQVHITLE